MEHIKTHDVEWKDAFEAPHSRKKNRQINLEYMKQVKTKKVIGLYGFTPVPSLTKIEKEDRKK